MTLVIKTPVSLAVAARHCVHYRPSKPQQLIECLKRTWSYGGCFSGCKITSLVKDTHRNLHASRHLRGKSSFVASPAPAFCWQSRLQVGRENWVTSCVTADVIGYPGCCPRCCLGCAAGRPTAGRWPVRRIQRIRHVYTEGRENGATYFYSNLGRWRPVLINRSVLHLSSWGWMVGRILARSSAVDFWMHQCKRIVKIWHLSSFAEVIDRTYKVPPFSWLTVYLRGVRMSPGRAWIWRLPVSRKVDRAYHPERPLHKILEH